MIEIIISKRDQSLENDGSDIQISITIKQTYEMVLIKTEDEVQVKLPSLTRPVLKFSWDLKSREKVYKEHWKLLKQSVLTQSPFKIVFNWTDGEQSIDLDGTSLTFKLLTHEHGTFEYWIPVSSFKDEILTMIDDILVIYPDEPLPKSFLYPKTEFPLFFMTKMGDDIQLEHVTHQYSNSRFICITVERASQLLERLKEFVETGAIVGHYDGIYYSSNQIYVQYSAGPWTTSFSIPPNRVEMVVTELTRVL